MLLVFCLVLTLGIRKLTATKDPVTYA